VSETQSPDSEPAHDVLAAELFGMPAPDPDLHHHGPVRLPDDPTGIEEPHDVLAAEEFPLPAPHHVSHELAPKQPGVPRPIAVLVAVLLLARLIRRRRRRA
jgi:hypothetical protein